MADEKHKQAVRDATERCKPELILAGVKVEHLEDMPEVRDWSLGDWAQRG